VSLQQALEQLAAGSLPILAGGTDFFPALQEAAPPAQVIDITRLAELQKLRYDEHGWCIGAGVTWSDVLNAELPNAFDGLKAAAREVGSIQIQNRATLVGNVCNASPAADGVPALLAMNASVELQQLGATRLIPLQDFITGVRQTLRQPNEIVTAIRIPPLDAREHSEFVKLGSRRYLVISIAMLAINLHCDTNGQVQRIAIAVGACSPVAQRLTELEEALCGLSVLDVRSAKWLDAIASANLHCLQPIDDIRGTAAFRSNAVSTLLQRTLTTVAQRCADSLKA